jgi:hypothetical protein
LEGKDRNFSKIAKYSSNGERVRERGSRIFYAHLTQLVKNYLSPAIEAEGILWKHLCGHCKVNYRYYR